MAAVRNYPEWALIAGGAGFIGQAIGLRLRSQGMRVEIVDTSLPRDPKLAEASSVVDLANLDETIAYAQGILRREGPPSVIVSTLGLYERRSLFEYDDISVSAMLRSNFTALVYLVRAFLKSMLERGSGQILAVTSQAGVIGTRDPLYAATKAAVTAFVKSLAVEYGQTGLIFNIVSCGPVAGTRMAAEISLQRHEYYRHTISIGRIIELDEAAEFMMSLILNKNFATSGVTFDLDGGMVRR
jgi:NAD(P)-dependent dehydrogenase (short-subunit alcohol dehydrogenase family)